MARIIEQAVQPQCTPRELQKIIREDTGTRLYITNVRKAMRRHGLTPKIPQKVHINRAGKEAVRRHDPQLRIVPSMPIILQMCAPKHATFV